jgi:hypothetical protein
LTGENKIHEEVTEADLITEGTTKLIEETTAYNDNEIKGTTENTAEEYNSFDDEAIDEEISLIQHNSEEYNGKIYVLPNTVQDQQFREESERIEKSLINIFLLINKNLAIIMVVIKVWIIIMGLTTEVHW